MDQNIKIRLKELVDRFEKNEHELVSSSSTYNETEVRSDFINEFFLLLGWDVLNKRGLPKPLREVVLEANVGVNEQTKKPDYEFRLNGIRKFFVEAKKPSVDINTSKESAFQTKRYGWSAKLPISILTNFKRLVIYDCFPVPKEEDDPRVAIIKEYDYKELVEKFEEIYSLISKEAVINGDFDKKFNISPEERKGEKPFDDFFLEQIEKWRLILAQDLIKNNPKIGLEELNYLIQVFINRIVFLRICEDRNLERYGSLKSLKADQAVKELLNLFLEADKKYDSGLFDFIKDKLSPSVKLSGDILVGIVNDLYYPNSPYTFSVIEPKILGDIYDQFISKVVLISSENKPVIEIKPEIKAAQGVFITPYFIVKEIVTKTFSSKLGESPTIEDLKELKVIDPSCGSGIFLVEAYKYLLDKYLELYLTGSNTRNLRQDDNGDYLLTLEEKKQILISSIFGVDIDEQAVEVAKFSLLLKVLEDVPKGEIDAEKTHNLKALPPLESNLKVGNTLIDSTYMKFKNTSTLSVEEYHLIRPFLWNESFSAIFSKSNPGFDVIVGNPPYTRIQNIIQYQPLEAKYYQSEISPYMSSKSNNFDKYQLFIERSTALLNAGGVLGYIVPHKFMTIKAGEPLREFISTTKYLQEIIHFGILQIFGSQSTTYTCILILKKEINESFQFEKVDTLSRWTSSIDNQITLPEQSLTKDSWIFPTKQQKDMFDTIEQKFSKKLNDIAEIFVGLQTSADDIYIISPITIGSSIRFRDKNGRQWEVEKEIFREAILDQSVHFFKHLESNRLILFPYKYTNDEIILIPENEMKAKYSKAYNYLLRFKSELMKRDLGNNSTWYQFGRSQSLNKFKSPKLVIKNPSMFACVAYDRGEIMFTGGGNGPYYGIRPKDNISIFLLQGLINHPLFDSWVKLRSSVFRGGYYSFGRQFITNFPVFNLDEMTTKIKLEQVAELWRKIDQLNHEATSTPQRMEELLKLKKLHKNEADKLICQVYNVSESILVTETTHED